ncbi:MAG: type II/IV secretion system protein [Desulfonatronovibrio sp. MSAO_Bac4]|nr:MAG: type II/IV secretion system protein [Desulfonatronovibrio sp. MSAO_Bac4]
MSDSIKIGDLLMNKGLIQNKHMEYALQVQRVTREKIGRILTRLGIVSEYDMVRVIARQLEIPCVDLTRWKPDLEWLKKFKRNFCLRNRVLPLGLHKNCLAVATSEVPGPQLEQKIQRLSGKKTRFALTEEHHLINFIYNHFFFMERPVEDFLDMEIKSLSADAGNNLSPDNFLEYLLLWAIKNQATDIHIISMEQGIRVAFRIDGVLQDKVFLPTQLKRIITAIKLQAGMDISEQRIPQDGRWTVRLLERSYDIRVSSLVTPYGESLVMRLLVLGQAHISLSGLGFLDDDLPLLHKAFEEPYGIILLTGPTGSGKSTTLVAGLTSVDLLDKNAITIEDPVEYVIPLARQTQVNEAAGHEFATAMRNFLRHDPDIILIGEMRDEVTAKTALTAAVTGHLVLSTLHSNSALGAIPRLMGLGIDNLTISETLITVVSQRLIRTICTHCAEKYPLTEEEKNYINKNLEFGYKGKGCTQCDNSGYKGRTVIYEILPVSGELRRIIEKGATKQELEKTAFDQGFRNIFQVAVDKVEAGLTSVDEVKRVLGRFWL